jgi:hypothetical protein
MAVVEDKCNADLREAESRFVVLRVVEASGEDLLQGTRLDVTVRRKRGQRDTLPGTI